ncbi:MAG: hypothetical protein A3J93_00235 [Candidatus Magasanikbacteria bacterium RIFOXYC2_FULL_42_28]|uniref:Ribosomal RNA small subunit methyltransferase I n=1 Tax=Candidatus Magasanikbacteria bacterium RIFOXYC2_FULL_42_28 TaxID=1798704 RepID=A0A1F6NW34_9BACT|nr:MAG: hypothetical protein A3J93_00235 [Candidatus Magasanikbacteria bacterium RIFOXYC2_FULL_42_28]
MEKGKLYIVATPIGNLDDITLRALATLKSVDFILCEDTRVTKNLLDRYEIVKPTISYHQHSDARKTKEIIELLENGKNLALVTDAGTPGISDPGNLLIATLLSFRTHAVGEKSPSRSPNDNGDSSSLRSLGMTNDDKVQIVPIPGPCAAIAALSISGFPTDKYFFMGFPPHKNKRHKFFQEVATAKYTVVFYESGHRITKCLTELQKFLKPEQKIIIARELTKKFETIYRGTAGDIGNMQVEERGEFTVIISN